ncbi:MAG TPA: DUF1841 family protein [Burkholderiaceae bacterium]|nr:DUF1841 family protein [Burkholderiaceae bacterium]
MFTPSREEVRRFFRDTWRKHRESQILTPLETMALGWIVEHPEYQDALSRDEIEDYSIEDGQTNPFLHLAMHLAIAEQLSIDQPPGIRGAYQRLVQRRGDAHAAAHDVMECLGEAVWAAQRAGDAVPPDVMTQDYLDCLRRRAGGE